MLMSSLCFFILTISCIISAYVHSSELYDVDLVLAPNFLPVTSGPAVNSSGGNATLVVAPLVLKPIVVEINDTAAWIQFTFNGTSSVSKYPEYFEIERSDDFADDWQFIDKTSSSDAFSQSNGLFSKLYHLVNLLPLSTYRVRILPVFKQGGKGNPSAPVTLTTTNPPINFWEQILPRRSALGGYGRGFSDPVLARPHLTPGVEVFGERTRASNNTDTRNVTGLDTLRSTNNWYSDAPHSEARELPSGRRGASLTLLGGKVYMFGGRTNGYSCASVLKDTVNMGLKGSGSDIYPCVSMQAEVNELWSFDLSDYTWLYLNTSLPPPYPPTHPNISLPSTPTSPTNTPMPPSSPPPAREQHLAMAWAEGLYVYGGKSREHPLDAFGRPVMSQGGDVVYGDVWRGGEVTPSWMTFPTPPVPSPASADDDSDDNHAPVRPAPTPLPSSGVLHLNLTPRLPRQRDDMTLSPRGGYCVKDMKIKVTIRHSCLSQTRLSILGPGPSTSSPNFFAPSSQYEVGVYGDLRGGGWGGGGGACADGIFNLTFSDSGEVTLAGQEITAESAVKLQLNGSTFAPSGKLHTFFDAPLLANWTIVVEDMAADELTGEILDWSIEFLTCPCYPRFVWQNITSQISGPLPPARYAARGLVFRDYWYIYGGKGAGISNSNSGIGEDGYLQDLYRIHLPTLSSTRLTPARFSTPFAPSSLMGGSVVMSPWGIMQLGGYARLPSLNPSFSSAQQSVGGSPSYTNQLLVLDPVTLRWKAANISAPPAPNPFDPLTTRSWPRGRYMASAVYLPSLFPPALPDDLPQTTQSSTPPASLIYPRRSWSVNHQGAISESILWFGGVDGALGSQVDGSGGGYVNELWMLRLNAYSTPAQHRDVRVYRDMVCKGKGGGGGAVGGCLSSVTDAPCEMRDLLLLAWCEGRNQTMLH